MGEEGETPRSITLLALGITGSGKSSLLNMLVGSEEFAMSDSADPVTEEAESRSVDNEYGTVHVIDTPGLEDGTKPNDARIRNIAEFLKKWAHGVNAIMAVFNGQEPRFSEAPRKIIRFIYNAFGATPEVLNHMCVVFTKCYAGTPKRPNRERLRTDYRRRIQEQLGELTKGAIDTELLPVFFVDSQPEPEDERAETADSVVRLLTWAASKPALPSTCFQRVHTNYLAVAEERLKVEVGVEIKERCRWRVFADQMREKRAPYNGDPPSYSEWEEVRRYSEQDTKVETEVQENVQVNRTIGDDCRSIYCNYVNRQRDKITSLRGDEPPRYGEWVNTKEWTVKVGEVEPRVVERVIREVVAAPAQTAPVRGRPAATRRTTTTATTRTATRRQTGAITLSNALAVVRKAGYAVTRKVARS